MISFFHLSTIAIFASFEIKDINVYVSRHDKNYGRIRHQGEMWNSQKSIILTRYKNEMSMSICINRKEISKFNVIND